MVEYSAGMTKKIGLACALIHAPRLVILDEPFESVDPVSGEHIRAILRGYVASGGTVVLSSHVMELVESLCDELAVVAQGRVLAAGTLDEVRGDGQPAAPLPRAGGLHRGRGGGAGMVAILVRLKLSLLRNALRRSVWRTVGLIIGIVYALGVVVLALVGLVALRWSSVALTADVTVLAFAIADRRLAAAVVAGVRHRRDPRPGPVRPAAGARPGDHARAAGLRSGRAAPASRPCWSRSGLLASWSRGVGPVLATVVAIPIGVATCFLLSRAGTAAFAAVLSSRRFRDFAFVGLAGLGLVFGVGANLVGGLLGQGVDRFRTC